MSFKSNQKLKFPLTGSVVLNRVAALIEGQCSRRPDCRPAQLGVGQRLVRQPLQLEASSLQSAELRQARGKQLGGDTRCTRERISLIASDFRAGGGTTLTATSRIDVESSPAATENLKRLIDRSIRPRNSPPSTDRSGSPASSPSAKR